MVCSHHRICCWSAYLPKTPPPSKCQSLFYRRNLLNRKPVIRRVRHRCAQYGFGAIEGARRQEGRRGGTYGSSQVPRPTFGSGSGLQCVYTVVISLWGTPAPKFVLEPPKTVFYWILLCIRKPQAEFQKFSSTHVSPSNRFISSPQLPLLVGTKDEEYLPIWTLYFSVHVSLHFFVDDLP